MINVVLQFKLFKKGQQYKEWDYEITRARGIYNLYFNKSKHEFGLVLN